MSTHRWCESDGSTMHFYQCRFSLLNVANHLSNCINMLHEAKTNEMLNANDVPFVREAHDNATSTAEKKKSRTSSDNGDKVKNENEWKTPSKKKHTSNTQRCKVEEKLRDQLNKFGRLQEMLGEDEETCETLREAALKDDNRNANQMKKHGKEKRVISCRECEIA